MNRFALSWPQAVVLVAAMAFTFFWVRSGLGDVKAAMTMAAEGAFALWCLFQKPGVKQ